MGACAVLARRPTSLLLILEVRPLRAGPPLRLGTQTLLVIILSPLRLVSILHKVPKLATAVPLAHKRNHDANEGR